MPQRAVLPHRRAPRPLGSRTSPTSAIRLLATAALALTTLLAGSSVALADPATATPVTAPAPAMAPATAAAAPTSAPAAHAGVRADPGDSYLLTSADTPITSIHNRYITASCADGYYVRPSDGTAWAAADYPDTFSGTETLSGSVFHAVNPPAKWSDPYDLVGGVTAYRTVAPGYFKLGDSGHVQFSWWCDAVPSWAYAGAGSAAAPAPTPAATQVPPPAGGVASPTGGVGITPIGPGCYHCQTELAAFVNTLTGDPLAITGGKVGNDVAMTTQPAADGGPQIFQLLNATSGGDWQGIPSFVSFMYSPPGYHPIIQWVLGADGNNQVNVYSGDASGTTTNGTWAMCYFCLTPTTKGGRQIINTSSGECLTADPTPGNPAYLETCNNIKPEQEWFLDTNAGVGDAGPAPTAPPTPTGTAPSGTSSIPTSAAAPTAAALAATGADTTPLLLGAAVMLIVGCALLATARRRTRPRHRTA